jgi:phosphatidylserine/phosphatidylglycerophosphate/cardiolipin synthase-like enzyme
MNDDVQLFFSPNQVFKEDIAQKIIDALNAETSEILHLCYSFTHTGIESAIEAAITRGISYMGAWDKGSTHGGQASFHDSIVSAGGKINLVKGFGSYGIQHAKVFIFGRKLFMGGSFNFTFNAQDNNYEEFLIVSDPAIVDIAVTGFQTIYGNGVTEVSGIKRPIVRAARAIRHALSGSRSF